MKTQPTWTQKCDVPECERPKYALGFCAAHYKRKLRGHRTVKGAVRESRGPLVALTTRITAAAFKKLEAVAGGSYAKAAQVLEDWASGQK